MNKKKIPIILFVALFLLIIVTLLLSAFGIAAYLNEKRYREDNLKKNAEILSEQIAIGLSSPIWNIDFKQIELFANGIMKDKNIYGIIVTPKEKDMSEYILKRDLKWKNISVKYRFEEKNLIYNKENITFKNENIGTVEVFMSKSL